MSSATGSAASFTPMQGQVLTTARLNIRSGAPATTVPVVRRVEVGTTLAVTGLARGEMVRGNDAWYSGGDDTFFWAGATAGFEPREDGVSSTFRVRRRADGTIRVLTEAEIRAIFGDIRATEASGGRVTLEQAWVKANLVDVAIPTLARIGVSAVTLHSKAQGPFVRAFARIEEAGLGDRVLQYGGSFVPRHKSWKPMRGLSAHTWAIAMDLNVPWNGYGIVPASVGSHGSVRELVPHFEAEGIAWGGYFDTADGMHFELANLDA